MADLTYYVAMPFLQDETGSPMAGAAEECQSSSSALRRAEILSRAAGSIGAVAFSRTGDPMSGEFAEAKLLRKFGNVPDDLSGLRLASRDHQNRLQLVNQLRALLPSCADGMTHTSRVWSRLCRRYGLPPAVFAVCAHTSRYRLLPAPFPNPHGHREWPRRRMHPRQRSAHRT